MPYRHQTLRRSGGFWFLIVVLSGLAASWMPTDAQDQPSKETKPGGSGIKPKLGKKPGEAMKATSLKMAFCWCPPGSFTMGSPMTEPGHSGLEGPVDVTLTRGFWIGKYEVTQGEWQKVMNTTVRDQFKLPNDGSITGVDPTHPIYLVNHDEAEEFCRRVTEMDRKAKKLPDGWVYRLPTEAEWEYACRAGTKTATAFGAGLTKGQQANFGSENPLHGTVAVGSFKSNSWGVHDMHGNVKEWCADGSGDRLSGGEDPFTKPTGTILQFNARGGGFNNSADDCRSAGRHNIDAKERWGDIGFRVVFGPAIDQ